MFCYYTQNCIKIDPNQLPLNSIAQSTDLLHSYVDTVLHTTSTYFSNRKHIRGGSVKFLFSIFFIFFQPLQLFNQSIKSYEFPKDVLTKFMIIAKSQARYNIRMPTSVPLSPTKSQPVESFQISLDYAKKFPPKKFANTISGLRVCVTRRYVLCACMNV